MLRQPHNVLSLIYSGLLFGSNYSLTYTASRTFAASPYNYDPLEVGLVLLALGAGGVFGSILGGKYSDHVLATVRARDGRAEPEERIRSVLVPMVVLPPMFVAYAWLADYHIHVAACCVVLFLLGFAQIWIYSSTLSYVVDSNKGRSSGAVACNSAFRGTIAFIASEVRLPFPTLAFPPHPH